jgi:hypothetical protein
MAMKLWVQLSKYQLLFNDSLTIHCLCRLTENIPKHQSSVY